MMTVHGNPSGIDCNCWNCQNLLSDWVDVGIEFMATAEELYDNGLIGHYAYTEFEAMYERINDLIDGKVRRTPTAQYSDG